ncbi:LuxR C-terminal-related transcriptional regulator [Lentzea sp. NPDC051213]|uniref:helix-turn-helix transcriptional regulator n=1 Tax=Lentzea sp. NPDC051213 TaxID=3364126 RepID=UPI003798C15D
MRQVRVAVHASDQLSFSGLAAYLRPNPEFVVAPWCASDGAEVVLVVGDSPAEVAALMKVGAQRSPGVPVIVIAGVLSREVIAVAARIGVVRIMDRSVMTREELAGWIAAAAAGGKQDRVRFAETIPSHAGGLRHLTVAEQQQTRGFERREIEVLRLLADGLDTQEIADRLFYSERTVKTIISGISMRMNLRNRPHAVAYAVRVGAI